MAMSRNMLNFLGYALEGSGFMERRDAVGLAYPFGIKSMLKQGLIQPDTFTLTVGENGPIPGVPYGASWEGFSLTEKGRMVGKVGLKARAQTRGYADEAWETYVQEADVLLKGAI